MSRTKCLPAICSAQIDAEDKSPNATTEGQQVQLTELRERANRCSVLL